MSSIRFLAALLFAAISALQAAEPSPRAAGEPAGFNHRYLLLVDTSAGMERCRTNTEFAVRTLVNSGMQGEMGPGDAFAIWPYRERVVVDAFAPETWLPPLRDELASTAYSFMKGLQYEGTSLFYMALVEAFKVIKASKVVTLLIFSDGTEMLQGTPFDLYANTIYRDHAAQLRKERKPFVTALLAVDGKVVGCTVGSGGDKLVLPSMPDDVKQKLLGELAAARAAMRPAPAATAPLTKPAATATVKSTAKKSAPSPSVNPPPPPAPAPAVTPAPLTPAVSVIPAPTPPTAAAPMPAAPAVPVVTPEPVAPQPSPPAVAIPPTAAPPGAVAVNPPSPTLATVDPAAASHRNRLLIIGLGLVVVAAVIVVLMLRGNRDPNRKSLISRSFDR